jgi:3-oxoacyl-[acyl-carrier-protein] synthase-3
VGRRPEGHTGFGAVDGKAIVTSRIIGTGRALPERRLTNADLEKMVDTSDAWIMERTGIRERRILDESLATSDLATEAGRNACEAAGVPPSDIDCIIVGTVTPDALLPATAAYVQQKLGVPPGVAAFDLSAACAGFLYGLSVGHAFIRSGQFKRILVIGVEVLSRIIDWTDRNTCVLFGDGAGAVVLVPEQDKSRGILSTHLYTDGRYADTLCRPAGGTRKPLTAELLAQREHCVKMNGREVFKSGVRNMSDAALAALKSAGFGLDDVRWVFAHQANIRIVEGIANRLNFPLDRFFVNIERYGNTSSASLAIALDEAVRQDSVKPGDLLVMTAFGAGFAWASAAVRW